MKRDLVVTGSLLATGMLTVTSGAIVAPALLALADYLGGSRTGGDGGQPVSGHTLRGHRGGSPRSRLAGRSSGTVADPDRIRAAFDTRRCQQLLDRPVCALAGRKIRIGLRHCRDCYQFRLALGGPAGRDQTPEPAGQTIRLHQYGRTAISVSGGTDGRRTLAVALPALPLACRAAAVHGAQPAHPALGAGFPGNGCRRRVCPVATRPCAACTAPDVWP